MSSRKPKILKIVLLGTEDSGKREIYSEFYAEDRPIYYSNGIEYKLSTMNDMNSGKKEIYSKQHAEYHEPMYNINGVEFLLILRKEIDSGISRTYQIWDLNPKNRFDFMRSSYFLGSKGGIIAFDVTKPETFNRAKEYIKELKEHLSEDIPYVLLGFNVEGREDRSELIERAEARQIAGLCYFEIEKENRSNFYVAIDELAREIIELNEFKINEFKINEFKINECISLKLEGDLTIIYIKGKIFRQCKFLLLNIKVDEITSLDKIDSIDEAAEKLDRSMERTRSQSRISPETEFWGHCSNLQVWAENNYDTRLLHSNLSFPLLKELVNTGDVIAKKVFGEEIAKRIESGHVPVIIFLINEKYLEYLNKEQKEVVIAHLIQIISNLDVEIHKEPIMTIYYHIGRMYCMLNKYDKAIIISKKAIEIDPMDNLSWSNLGVCYTEKGDYDKALIAFKKCHEINPKDEIIINNLGWLYDLLGEYDKAIEACNKVIEIDPKFANPWNHLGYALYKKGDHYKAIELIKKSMSLEPKYSRAPYYLAVIYFDLECYEEALNACDLCLESVRSNIDIYLKASFNVKTCVELREKIIKILNSIKK